MNCNNIIKSTYRSHLSAVLLVFFGCVHLLLSSAETEETVVSKSTWAVALKGMSLSTECLSVSVKIRPDRVGNI